MGSDNSVLESKPKYFPQTEIAKENTFFLRDLFINNKNSDGYIDQLGLSHITNNLIDKPTLEIIFQICASRNKKLSYNDFLYFYSLLKTKTFYAKLNFIIYFIFIKDENLSKYIYIKNVNKYYKRSYLLSKILLNENIINTDIIEKKKFLILLKIISKKK